MARLYAYSDTGRSRLYRRDWRQSRGPGPGTVGIDQADRGSTIALHCEAKSLQQVDFAPARSWGGSLCSVVMCDIDHFSNRSTIPMHDGRPTKCCGKLANRLAEECCDRLGHCLPSRGEGILVIMPDTPGRTSPGRLPSAFADAGGPSARSMSVPEVAIYRIHADRAGRRPFTGRPAGHEWPTPWNQKKTGPGGETPPPNFALYHAKSAGRKPRRKASPA